MVFEAKNKVIEELRAKYVFDFLPTVRSYDEKHILDSCFPNLFSRLLRDDALYFSDSVEKTGYSFSDSIAGILGIKTVSTEDSLKMLGYSKKHIKDLIVSVKAKQFSLFLVGFGGTGVNFNYWMDKMLELVEEHSIFNTIYIYDPDRFEISNLPRVPLNLSNKYKESFKVNFFDNKRIISRNLYIDSKKMNEQDIAYFANEGQYIAYGAPTINTRQELSKSNLAFVSATHANNDCQLYLNPIQDSDIQVEGYGKINLNTFFLNHLKMTIVFLEYLSSVNDIRDIRKNSELLFEFDFEKYYKSNHTKKIFKDYNFHI